MPMLQAILLSAGDFARGALHAKNFPEPIRMQLLDFYSRAHKCAWCAKFGEDWTKTMAVVPKWVQSCVVEQPLSRTLDCFRHRDFSAVAKYPGNRKR